MVIVSNGDPSKNPVGWDKYHYPGNQRKTCCLLLLIASEHDKQPR